MTPQESLTNFFRYGIIDLIRSDIIKVSDQVGCIKFIKESSDEFIRKISKLETEDSLTKIVNEGFTTSLRKQGSQVLVISEKNINDSINTILEADDYATGGGHGGKDVNKAKETILYGSFPAMALLYFHDPVSFRKASIELKRGARLQALRAAYNLSKFGQYRATKDKDNFKYDNFQTWWKKQRIDGRDTAIDELKDTIKHPIKLGIGASEKASKIIKTSGIVVASVLATAAAGVAIYRRFFSKAAKACNNLPATQKSICMWKFKLNAAQQALTAVKNQKSKCTQAKNPEKCNYEHNQLIWQWEQRIKRYQARLQKHGNELILTKSGESSNPFDK